MGSELKPCPFCGCRMPSDGGHDKDCYFSVLADIHAAPKGDISGVPVLLAAWNRRTEGAAALPAPADEYAQRLAFLSKLTPEDMLEELLALIHRDGGHYSDRHGLAKAVADAELLWFASPLTSAAEGEEPVAWQWRRKDEPWSLERTFNSQVHATTADSEVRALYARPIESSPTSPQSGGDAKENQG